MDRSGQSERDYDPRFYVERKCDAALFDACREWMRNRDSVRWINVATASGRGNTWLADNLNHRLMRDSAFKITARSLVVRAPRSSDPAPQELSHLTAALVAPLRGHHPLLRPLRLLLRAATRKPFLTTFLFVCSVAAALVIVGIADYVQTKGDTQPALFFSSYLLQHLVRVAILLGAAILLPLTWIPIRKLLQEVEHRKPEMSAADREYLSSREAIADGIERLGKNREAVVLIVDRAHLLDLQDRGILRDLCELASDNHFARVRSRFRLLIVTIDEGDIWQDVIRRTPRSRVVVSPFSLQELKEVAHRQRPELHDEIMRDTENARDILDNAQHSIHELFGIQESLQHTMGDIFQVTEALNLGSSFGPEMVMVYQAIRILGAGESMSASASEIARWTQSLCGSEHLKAFGVGDPGVDTLVQHFRTKSTLVQTPFGKTFVIDYTRSEALITWIRQATSWRSLAARAYWYWAEATMSSVDSVDPRQLLYGDVSVDMRLAIRKAGWYVKQINEFAEPTDLLDSVSDNLRRKVETKLVTILMLASVVYLRDGDTGRGLDLTEDVCEWLNLDAFPGDRLVGALTSMLWETFWLTGDERVRKAIDSLSERLQSLSDSVVWKVNEQFGRLIAAAPAEPLTGIDADAAAEFAPVVNRLRLVESWRAIRASRGFAYSATQWPALGMLEPNAGDEPSIAAALLMSSTVHAMLPERPRAALEMIGRWRDQRASRMRPIFLADEVLVEFEMAVLLHAETAARLADGEEVANVEDLVREASERYEEALRLATLLEWRTFSGDVVFHRALLASSISAKSYSGGEAPWEWWEPLFRETLALEAEQERFFLSPDILAVRWRYFRDVARNMSLNDGFETYQAAKRVALPDHVLVYLHRSLMEDFNNAASEKSVKLRSAELHRDWARSLADTGAGRKAWSCSTLEFEQAQSLMFAAQGLRLGENNKDAEDLLDEADRLLAAAVGDEAERRKIVLEIRYQRVQLLRGQSREVASAALRDLWRDLLWTDADLGSLVLSEIIADEVALFDQPWRSDENGLAPDPDAPQLSLSSDVINQISSPTRYEYRFFQLTSGFGPYVGGSADFYEAVLHVVSYGAAHPVRLSRIRGYVLAVLSMLREAFEAVRDDHNEIETLRFLVELSNGSGQYMAAYGLKLAEHEKLLERQIDLLGRKARDWYEFARRMHHLFNVLVSEDLTHFALRRRVDATSMDLSGYENLLEKRRAASDQGIDEFHAQNFKACFATLTPVLPVPNEPWVSWLDLEILHMWLQCADETGYAEVDRDTRANQLRIGIVAYVQQLSQTVSEAQAQRVALKVVKLLEKALQKQTILPIRLPGGPEQMPRPMPPPDPPEKLSRATAP